MRSEGTHLNSKAALNKQKKKKENWKYKASYKYSKKWFPELSCQTESIKVAGKSSMVELNKEASSPIPVP